jgi:hypothetical protein
VTPFSVDTTGRRDLTHDTILRRALTHDPVLPRLLIHDSLDMFSCDMGKKENPLDSILV